MSNMSVNLKPEELRSLAFGSVSGTYANLGPAFQHPIVLFHIVNDLDVDVIISFFNQENHLFVKTGSFVLYDVAANREDPSGYRNFSRLTQIQVKQASGAAGSGSIYLSTFYAGD